MEDKLVWIVEFVGKGPHGCLHDDAKAIYQFFPEYIILTVSPGYFLCRNSQITKVKSFDKTSFLYYSYMFRTEKII